MPATRSSRGGLEPITHLDALRHTMKNFSRRTAKVFTEAVLRAAADPRPPSVRRKQMAHIVKTTTESIQRRQGLGDEAARVAGKLLCCACQHAIYLVADRAAAGEALCGPDDWADMGRN